MLEYFYESPWHLQHLRQGLLAEHVNSLAARLHRLGYARGSGQRILWLVGKFNDFARAIPIETAEQVDERLIKRFVDEESPSHHTFRYAPIAMRHLWEHLRDQGIVADVAETQPDDPFNSILRNYDELSLLQSRTGSEWLGPAGFGAGKEPRTPHYIEPGR